MTGLGTVMNVIGIVAGGILGLAFRTLLTEELKDNLIRATALCCIFIGIAGSVESSVKLVEGNLVAGGTMMVVASMAIGTLIGTLIGIEKGFETFGTWLKHKSGNASDSGFVNAFVVTSLTVCIGAMAVVGAIKDGIAGDYSILAAKSVMDLIIVMALSASLGKGCMFSAVAVGLFQGAITLCAGWIEPLLSAEGIRNLSLVGALMIMCVGINLIWGKKFSVADMLPALLIAVLYPVVAAWF